MSQARIYNNSKKKINSNQQIIYMINHTLRFLRTKITQYHHILNKTNNFLLIKIISNQKILGRQ